MNKIDLHTHSAGSPDGGISHAQYKSILSSGQLDFVAITDHDHIEDALALQALLGEKIIVGEEISTTQGEIIGLYLKTLVAPGMSAMDTAVAIKSQGGLVYIPHPFETVRHGITKSTLDNIATLVDIVETHNGRAFFQNKGPAAVVWTRLNNTAVAASSDAHGLKGVGTSFTALAQPPTAKNLVEQLRTAHLHVQRPPLSSLLYPKYHRLRAKLKRN